MSEDLDIRRKRAGFRARHRGTKEMDWLLGHYADATLSGMTEEQLARFERFLVVPDPELHAWILSPELCGDEQFTGLLQQIRMFHKLAD